MPSAWEGEEGGLRDSAVGNTGRARSAGESETTTHRRERLLRQRVVILGLKHRGGDGMETHGGEGDARFYNLPRLVLPGGHSLTGFVIVCANISGDSCMTTLKGRGVGVDTGVKSNFW